MRQLCLIGDPVKHSLSPTLHGAAICALGLQKEYAYDNVRVPEKELEFFIAKVRKDGIAGFSVTMPHKENIVPLLDELTEDAKLCQSVNTVKVEEGRLIGHTTDGEGVVRALNAAGSFLSGKTVVLLGAGGAAKPIAIALAKEGIAKLAIINRDAKKAEHISMLLGGWPRYGGLDRLECVLKEADLVINATSFGMEGNHEGESLVPAQLLRKEMTVVDLVYKPLETKLLSDAKSVKAKTVDGTSVLLYQADTQFEIFTGKKPPLDALEKAVKERLEKVE